MSGKVQGDLAVSGHLSANTMTVPAGAVTDASVAGTAAIARSKLALESLAVYGVNLLNFKIYDAPETNLPGASSGNDLAVINSSGFGTNAPVLGTADLKAGGTVINYARNIFNVPPEYDTGETVTIRIRAAMRTTIADTTAGIDVVAYINDNDGGIGVDMIATAEQNMNSVTYADYDFTFSSSTVVPGDQIDYRIALGINDGVTGTAVIGTISEVAFLLDIRG